MFRFSIDSVKLQGDIHDIRNHARACLTYGLVKSIDIIDCTTNAITETVAIDANGYITFHQRLQRTAVPRFSSSWSDKMMKHIEMQPNPREYVRQHIQELCESWGDESKSYAIDRIVRKFNLSSDEHVGNITGVFFA